MSRNSSLFTTHSLTPFMYEFEELRNSCVYLANIFSMFNNKNNFVNNIISENPNLTH